MGDKLAGREPFAPETWSDAVAPTASDTVDEPTGVSQGIVCTGTAGNIKVTLVNNTTLTIAIATGWAGRQGWRIQRVWSTGTTATGLLLLYV